MYTWSMDWFGFHHFLEHWDDYLKGGLFALALCHSIRIFPMPDNKYLAWLVASIQYVAANYELARGKNGAAVPVPVKPPE